LWMSIHDGMGTGTGGGPEKHALPGERTGSHVASTLVWTASGLVGHEEATDRVTRSGPWKQEGGGGQGHGAQGARRPAGGLRTGSPGGGGTPPISSPIRNLAGSVRHPLDSPALGGPGVNHQLLATIRGGARVLWRSGLFEIPYKKCYVLGVISRPNRCTECDTTRKFGGYMEGWMLSTTCSRGVRGIIKRLGWWV